MSEKEISFKIDWTPEQKKAFKDITGFTELDDDYIKIEQLLNLIEKQQKELEDLKEKHKITEQMNENLIEALKDSISKDKIKTKIKELNEIADEDNLEEYAKIDVLKELLEENNND